ncbi:hypothetical protein G7Y89_g9966 [Cudoniella acicularis]|uniref:Ketoreductase domain-containing protein n=1 Tax=Cudoniella acicularis TaxID=354080 RepID=A0A8H4W1E0_9HELO|nr:hypothetical protein G7Y89_g9966 [Cudoniella acicularis]
MEHIAAGSKTQPLERGKHDLYPFIDATRALKNSAKDKVVLVTGGSRSIGRSIARHFALAGAKNVIISARNQVSLDEAKASIEKESPQCQVLAVVADMTDARSVQQLYDDLPGTPDVIVNNVGAAACQERIFDSKIDLWWSDWELNVKACYLSSRAYLHALAGKKGVILNVSSSVSDLTNPGLSSYASAKTAINRLTEFIHLGMVASEAWERGILETGMGEKAPDYFKPFLYDTLGLAGGTAVYLSTPRASFLDGRFIFANYDMEQLETLKDEILEKDLLKQRIQFGDNLRSAVVPPS